MNVTDFLRHLRNGLSGVALREAQGDYLDYVNRVRGALQKRYEEAGKQDVWPDLYAVFSDHVVIREDGVIQSYPYVISADGSVTFGQPQRVEEQFVPPESVPAPASIPAANAQIVEALAAENGGQGQRFRVRIIRAGLSGNGNYYSAAVLREAAPRFEGARVFVKSDAEHTKGGGKDFRNLIGRAFDVRFVEGAGAGPDGGVMEGTLDVLVSAGDIAARLTEALHRGMAGLFGLSVDADGTARPGSIAGKPARIVTKISRVRSVDLIVEPGAGGGLLRLTEAQTEAQEDITMWRPRLITMIAARRPDLLKGVAAETLTDDEIDAKFREAYSDDAGTGAANAGADAIRAADEAARQIDARVYLRESLAGSKLPQAARDRLTAGFEGRAFGRPDVDTAIKSEREYIARFTESGRVQGLGGPRIEPGQGLAEKVRDRLDAFFDPAHKDHRHAQSFREAYQEITGDGRVTGRLDRCDQVRLTEALDSTAFALVLGDAVHRRAVALYNQQTALDAWRLVAQTGPASDFRDHHVVWWGGYGDLPAVTEGAAYQPLSTPDDEEAVYRVSKRGGTEAVTLEAVRNDDVLAIRSLPTKLTNAAKRTLSRGVFSVILNNIALPDGKTLFHADRGNLGTAALSKAAYSQARTAMLRQTEPGSSQELFIEPRRLLVPAELEEIAYNMFIRSANNDPDFVATLAPKIVPVWCQTDADDWTLMCDPAELPGLYVGFLDGNEEPEIFVQDNPNIGSLFSNDAITYKIRHIWGRTVVTPKAMRRNIVP